MIVGENPKKVVNLVKPIISIYRKEYEKAINNVSNEIELSLLKEEEILSKNIKANTIYDNTNFKMYKQVMDNNIRWQLCESLPLTMRNILLMNRRTIPPKKHVVRSALSAIVYRAAVSQSIKGIITAGIVKGSAYLMTKVAKKFPIINKLSMINKK
jgi:hypothetical protein